MKFISTINEATESFESTQVFLENIVTAVHEEKMQNKTVAKIAKEVYLGIELLKKIAKESEQKLQ